MAAYIIALMEKKKDAAALKAYLNKVPGTMPAGVKPLAAYGKFELLEGYPIEGAVILEFPTFEDAKTWYDSPAYQEVKAHRQQGGDYRMLIVEGR